MPFDGKTFADTTISGLIAWLETQDPAGEYDWNHPGQCLMCQWLSAAAGEPVRVVGPIEGYATAASRMLLPAPRQNPFEDIAYQQPRTFGAAFDRARAFRADNA